MQRFIFVFAFLTLNFFPATLHALEFCETAQRHSKKLCGIYAVDAALKSVGLLPDISKLLNSEFVSAASGSTGNDICRMIRLNGGHSVVFGSANSSTLRLLDSEFVAILNLAVRSDAKCQGHWVVYLGDVNGRAKIYDYGRSPTVYEINYEDLMTRWDGGTILVKKSPIGFVEYLKVFFDSVISRIILGAIIAGSFLILCRFRTTFQKSSYAVLLTILLAFVWQICDVNSVARNVAAARWMAVSINEPFENDFSASYADVQNNKSGFVFVDSRPSSQTLKSRIPHALSIGVDLHLDQVRLQTANLQKNVSLVVFCQSDSCRFADLMAHRFRLLGFRKICVFRPGINGLLDFEQQKSLENEHNKN